MPTLRNEKPLHDSLCLVDVFMPNDLCARCDLNEPEVKIWLDIATDEEKTRLFFCSEQCRDDFLKGWKAVGSLPFFG